MTTQNVNSERGGVSWSVWLDAASHDLDKIDTVKLACAGFHKEASAISAARVALDSAMKTRRYRLSRWWHDFTTEPEGQDGYCGI